MSTTTRSRRTQPDRYVVPISRRSYTVIQQLIEQGKLVNLPRPSDEKSDPIKGIRAAATYSFTTDTTIHAADAHHLNVNDQSVITDLYKMPSYAYSALVQGSPEFRELPGIEELLSRARTPNADPQQLQQLLEQVVSTGLQRDPLPRLIKTSQQFSAVWLPDQTLVHRTAKNDFFLTLTFNTRFQRQFRSPTPEPIAIDLGLQPMTSALHSGGVQQVFHSTPLTLPERYTLSTAAQQLHDRLLYASGRLDAEGVIAYLLYHASEVVAEKLRQDGMDRSYVLTARDRAIQDHHYAALPQYLNAARLSLHRLPAGYTSTECPQCHHVSGANRQGSHFQCRSCGHISDAHLVACQNLLHRHQRQQRRSA